MGGGYQRFGGFALQARQVDVQFDLQAEAAGNLADADLAGYRGVGGKGLLALAGNELQGPDEAGRVAGGEQLFRVGGRAAWPPSSRGVLSFTSSTPSEDTARPSRPPVAVALAV